MEKAGDLSETARFMSKWSDLVIEGLDKEMSEVR